MTSLCFYFTHKNIAGVSASTKKRHQKDMKTCGSVSIFRHVIGIPEDYNYSSTRKCLHSQWVFTKYKQRFKVS